MHWKKYSFFRMSIRESFPQYTSLNAYLYANTIFIDIVDTHFKRENRCNIPLQKFW